MSRDFLDPDTLALLKKRDHQAIELVVRRETKALFKGARSMGFPENEANELVQRVFVTFFEVVERFEGKSKISTFLFGILYKKAAEFRRESTKMIAIDPHDEEKELLFAPDGHWRHAPITPEKFASSSENQKNLSDCLDKLPTQQRLAFYLREVEGETSESISNSLEISITNLGVLLYRARNRLRLCIERKWNAGRANA